MHTYDALNRLTGASYSPFIDGSYMSSTTYNVNNIWYDGSGNLRGLLRYKPGWQYDYFEYQYASGTNRLSTVLDAALYEPVASFSYDASGRMTSTTGLYTVSNVSYDERGLPLSMGIGGSLQAQYRYSAEGRRVGKRSGMVPWAEWDYYVDDGRRQLALFRETSASSGSYELRYWNILLPDGTPIGKVKNETGLPRRYYLKDHLGSIRTSVNESGQVLETRDYYPFGLEMPERILTTGAKTREGFTGHELDAESDMNYAGARYYMPRLGRWTTTDPLADHPSQLGLSPYNYAWNNPTTLNDPDGQCPLCPAIVPILKKIGASVGIKKVAVSAGLGGVAGAGREMANQYSDGNPLRPGSYDLSRSLDGPRIGTAAVRDATAAAFLPHAAPLGLIPGSTVMAGAEVLAGGVERALNQETVVDEHAIADDAVSGSAGAAVYIGIQSIGSSSSSNASTGSFRQRLITAVIRQTASTLRNQVRHFDAKEVATTTEETEPWERKPVPADATRVQP